jgi:hypothetical protein
VSEVQSREELLRSWLRLREKLFRLEAAHHISRVMGRSRSGLGWQLRLLRGLVEAKGWELYDLDRDRPMVSQRLENVVVPASAIIVRGDRRG